MSRVGGKPGRRLADKDENGNADDADEARMKEKT